MISADRSNCSSHPHFIVGGGPAGLTAALILTESGETVVLAESSELVGGIARTESYKGYRFDIGGHRFFTKVQEVESFWQRIMGDDFITVPRLSRIYYDGKYYAYPLKVGNTLANLGLVESARIGLSYLKAKCFPCKPENTLDQWVTNRFGRRLFQRFFKTYTEKVWGIPCDRIQADWAAQRIQNLSLMRAVKTALVGGNDTRSLIEEFQYPRLGPGMMWERVAEEMQSLGACVHMRTRVRRVHHDGAGCVNGVTLVGVDGKVNLQPVASLINSMPLGQLVMSLEPPAPRAIQAAAERLRYRDFLIVALIIDDADPFPDNWIYIHSPEVQVGRIQNFRSWSEDMVPDATKSCVGMEYFCHVGDGLWDTSDAELIVQATRELKQLGLVEDDMVIDGTVIRQPKAYPVYDEAYREAVELIRGYIESFDNLYTVGRNGMHRYNNQDHSMLTAMLAARCVLGESHDVWDVNVERSYHEEFVTKPAQHRYRNSEALPSSQAFREERGDPQLVGTQHDAQGANDSPSNERLSA